MTILV